MIAAETGLWFPKTFIGFVHLKSSKKHWHILESNARNRKKRDSIILETFLANP